MSDGNDAGNGADATDPAEVAADTPDPDAEDDGGLRFRSILNYGLLAGLLVLALVATVGFYTAVSSAISLWVNDEWQPLFRATFNLAVLLVAGSGIAWQARRMA